jgi:hypothetical protein
LLLLLLPLRLLQPLQQHHSQLPQLRHLQHLLGNNLVQDQVQCLPVSLLLLLHPQQLLPLL